MPLVGVPFPGTHESPASWLSRLALTQGATIKEVYSYLGIQTKEDCDVVFTGHRLRRICQLTELPIGCFSFVQHMSVGVRQVDKYGHELFLRHDGQPRYRFCSACLATSKFKLFPLHWRFKAWRWCPKHMSMMTDKCPHCKSLVLLPGELLTAGRKKEGVDHLAHCLTCAGKLTVNWRQTIGTFSFSLLTPWEEVVLKNGRATLAALLHRKVRIEGNPAHFSLGGLRRVMKMGILPHDHFTLDHDEMLRRRSKAEELGMLLKQTQGVSETKC
ncbi:TniQ family protein [Hydrogenophaga crocea]|uniref:TniQ domain-containing protein n=1 Tax=Hydrogenophaga crocea TaxID=2716225 RepID=A0A6G8IHW3_9BURK|nr:hypothetical protein G9Q37_11595 [Hydrogenophaga crocea]